MGHRKALLAAGLILTLAIAAYSGSLKAEFQFDDYHQIVNNPAVENLKNLPRFFADIKFASLENRDFYRPVTLASFAVSYALSGNDVFGYHSGDNVIQLTGKILTEVCDPDQDFIGHIGGDDFIILFQSADWEARCKRALDRFADAILGFFSVEDRAREGYIAKDRHGEEVFYPLTSLSIGAVQVEPCKQASHHTISAAAAEAKKQAKGISGNSLFVERRAKCS